MVVLVEIFSVVDYWLLYLERIRFLVVVVVALLLLVMENVLIFVEQYLHID